MPSLELRLPDGTTRSVQLIKRITTVGRSADNDVVIADPSVPASALHLQLQGDDWNEVALDAAFFFKRRKMKEARQRDSDTIGVGGAEPLLAQASPAAPGAAAAKGVPPEAMEDFRKLHAFS